MRIILLLTFLHVFFYLLSFSAVFAEADQVQIDFLPTLLPSHQNTTLSINVTNLNSTNKVIRVDIDFPDKLRVYSLKSDNNSCTPYTLPVIKIINCSVSIGFGESLQLNVTATPIIDNSSENVSINFIVYYDDNSSYEVTKQIEIKDLSPPILTFVFPTNITYSPSAYNLTIGVSDNVRFYMAEVYWNNTKIGENVTILKSGSLFLNLISLPAGNQTLLINLTDIAGNSNLTTVVLEVRKAPNPIDVYINGLKNRNISVDVNSTLLINVTSFGRVCFNISGFGLLDVCGDETSSISVMVNQVGVYLLNAFSFGNQNYTQNTSNIIYEIKVIYPRISYNLIKAPRSEVYEPDKIYEFRVNFTSVAYPLNNVTNVSFALDNKVYYLPINDRKGGVFSYSIKDLPAGQYKWEFCAVDSQNERVCINGTLNISKAVPELDILNTGEYVVPVNKTIIAVGCPEQLVCNFYLNGTKLANNFYDLIVNKPGYYVFVYNTSGNQNYTSYQVIKTVRVVESKVSVNESKTNQTILEQPINYIEDIYRSWINKQNLYNFSSVFQNVINIDNEDLVKIRQVIIEVNSNQNNVYFEVTPLTKLPDKAPPGVSFVFIEVKTNISKDFIRSVKFRFKVDKFWIKSNSIDVSTIALYRWDGSTWEKLNTFRLTEDDEFVYFESHSNKLSILAITGEKIKKSNGFPWWIAVVIILVLVAIAFLLYLFLPIKKENSEYEKLKEKWRGKLSRLRTQ